MAKNIIVKGFSWSFAEKLLTELVNFLITIVLARLLLPNDYGAVAIIQIFINISSIFVTSGLGSSIIQNKNADEEQISTIFYINAIVGLFIYLVLFFIAPLIAKIYSNDQLTRLLRVLAIKIPLVSIYNIQHAYIQKNMKFKLFFFSSLVGTILAGIVGILIAYKGFGAWALVASTLVDQLIDMLMLFFTTHWWPKFKINFSKTKSMIKFGYRLLLSEIFSSIYNEFKSLVIGIKYTSADLAYNSKGKKFSYLPIEVANSSVRRVMFPAFSNSQDNREKVKELASNSIKIICFFTLPMLAGMIATANNFIPVLLTNNWIGCIPYVQIYCFTSIFNPLVITDIQIIQAYGEAKAYLTINVISSILDLIAISCAVFFFDKAIYIAMETVIITIIQVLIYCYVCNKLVGFGVISFINTIKTSALLSLTMGIAVFFIGKLFLYNQLLSLVVQIVSGIVIYIGLSFVFKTKELQSVIHYIKRK